MYDIVIKNGMVVDGTGNPWYKADVGVKDGKIVTVARGGLDDGEKVIDAAGLAVAPGFCDLHTHTDVTILFNNRAESSLHQGVTTEGIGQCGMSVYDITEESKDGIRQELAGLAGKDPSEVEVDWGSLEEWRDKVNGVGLGINLAPYCGYGTVRSSVMGMEGQGGERYAPTAEELDKMKALVRRSMEHGAFGMSTGLRYPPQQNAFTDEVIALTKIVAEYGAMYISHMRGESDTLIESTAELIAICREAGLRGCISHHKAILRENWGKPSETMRMVDRARASGLEIMCDQYPWTHAAASNLGGAFLQYLVTPEQSLEERMAKLENLMQEIQDAQSWEEVKARAREDYEKKVAAREERKKALGAKGIAVPHIWNPEVFYYVVHSPSNPEFVGKNLREIANAKGVEDYWDVARDLYVADEGHTIVASGIMSEEDVITILSHPATAVSTDGATYDTKPAPDDPRAGAHPRNWGTYPKVLQRYVRELKVLRLEEAVRKMTSLPLGFLGITDRGLIREGMWADITIFDPQNVTNMATYSQPTEYPQGIPYVVVNGQVAIENGEHTGALAGRVLTRA